MTPSEKPPRYTHSLEPCSVRTPKLALPVALLAGAGITAGTTYALVKWVQHLVATAAVSDDPARWMEEARNKDYGVCYFGCDGCGNPSAAHEACAKTAAANVTGVVCDGNAMWNWKERYPLECLEALGEDYKADALQRLKQSRRNRLALVILTVLAGIVGTVVVYKLWKKITRRRQFRADCNRLEAYSWPRLFGAPPWKKKANVEAAAAAAGKGGSRLVPRPTLRNPRSLFASLLAALCSVGKSSAFPCAGYDPSFNQYFVDANRTIFGVVTGWISDCYSVERCFMECSGSSETCNIECRTKTVSIKHPERFVEDMWPSVEECEFERQDAVEGDVHVRVANAGIEMNWWVMISVNGFNVTNLNETDQAVQCLYDIGNRSPQ